MEPRTWPAGSFRHPPGVHAVRDSGGLLWRHGTTRWTSDGERWIRWYTLSSARGPLTEVPGMEPIAQGSHPARVDK